MSSRERAPTMWADALQLLQEADRLHRQFFQLGAGRPSGPCWEPPVDVLETERTLLILVALPGVVPDQVQIIVDGGALLIVGERAIPAPSSGAVIRRLEIPYGRFERRIDLPAGRFEIDQRELEHGCLRLTLRKLL